MSGSYLVRKLSCQEVISYIQVDLTNKNVSIAIVGKDHPFTVYDDAGVDPYLAGIEGEERR